MNDPVLETLFLPLDDGQVTVPEDGRILVLRARPGAALDLLPRDRLICEQSFRPHHDALARAGFTLGDSTEGGFALTLVLPQRQREESRALLARAVMATRDGGIVMSAQSNVLGAKTLEGELESLTGHVTTLSKNKCRVFWARIDRSRVNTTQAADWLALDAPRYNAAGFLSRPGLFAWDRIDAGSRLLAEHLPHDLAGRAADLGAGFGYLTAELLARCPGIIHVDLYEAEARAVDLARQNLAAYGAKTACHWADVTQGIDPGHDVVISNPPFHIDRADRNDLGQAFVRAAAGGLRPGGQLWLVANRHLPYEATLKAAFKAVSLAVETGQYKVFKAIGPK